MSPCCCLHAVAGIIFINVLIAMLNFRLVMVLLYYVREPGE